AAPWSSTTITSGRPAATWRNGCGRSRGWRRRWRYLWRRLHHRWRWLWPITEKVELDPTGLQDRATWQGRRVIAQTLAIHEGAAWAPHVLDGKNAAALEDGEVIRRHLWRHERKPSVARRANAQALWQDHDLIGL